MSFPENTQEPAPIKLELARVDTVHVTMGSQKIASLCLVVKDSPEVDELMNHPYPVSKMIITDVVPSKDDPEKAEVIFRNLTNEEVIEMSRQFLLPQGTLMEIFGDVIEELGLTSSSQLSAANIENEIYDDEENVDETLNEEDEDVEVESLAEIISSHVLPFPEERKVLYSITMSLAEAHLGQMICVGTNAPAFVLTSENTVAQHNDQDVNVWEDFIALLEFPSLDTAEYFDSTASLIQAVTGAFPLNLTVEKINELRGKAVNDILRLANGSQKALIEAFGLINPMKKLLIKNSEKISEKPTAEETELYFMRDAIDKIYQITSPQTVAALIQEAPNASEYIDDIDTVNEIFRNSGLEEVFDTVLENEFGAEKVEAFKVPTKNSTKEELIAYYSAPLTPYTFPSSMVGLVPKIQMPLLYDNNWVGGTISFEPKDSNSGEIIVSQLITIAVRFARLSQIVQTVPSKLNPIGFLVQAINFPGENTIWSFLEAVSSLGKDEGEYIFDELLTAGLPRDNEQVPPEVLLQTPSAILYHRVGHLILEEGWAKEALMLSLKDSPLIQEFIDDVFASANELEDEEAQANRPCPIMLATLSLYALKSDYREIVHELGKTVKLLAELNALKNTDFTSGSPEWNEYIEGYLHGILQVDLH